MQFYVVMYLSWSMTISQIKVGTFDSPLTLRLDYCNLCDKYKLAVQ